MGCIYCHFPCAPSAVVGYNGARCASYSLGPGGRERAPDQRDHKAPSQARRRRYVAARHKANEACVQSVSMMHGPAKEGGSWRRMERTPGIICAYWQGS